MSIARGSRFHTFRNIAFRSSLARVPILPQACGPETTARSIDGRWRWTIEPCGRRWSAIGLLRTRAISRSNMRSTARMPCFEYPQSGERLRGRRNIQESRFVQPNKKRFAVRKIVGSGELWITEFILSYDDIPSYAVSIMEFREGLVAHETQYFAEPFDPAPSRAHLVERAGSTGGGTQPPPLRRVR